MLTTHKVGKPRPTYAQKIDFPDKLLYRKTLRGYDVTIL